MWMDKWVSEWKERQEQNLGVTGGRRMHTSSHSVQMNGCLPPDSVQH